MTISLELRPSTLAAANRFIGQHHRHNGRVRGGLFALSAWKDGRLVGVAVVGRPVSRMLQDGFTAEATRICTDGTKNASSFLYGRAWRAAQALGYRRMVTYTLQSEPGGSLRAAGWRVVGETKGKGWGRGEGGGRPRRSHAVYREPKLRWQAPTVQNDQEGSS